MAVEEQTVHDDPYNLGPTYNYGVGQRLTIANRLVTKLAFWLTKYTASQGTVTFTIRKVSDDSIIVSKLWGNAVDLPAGYELLEVTFDTPETINEEVRILAETDGFAEGFRARIGYENSDIKADEVFTQKDNGTFTDVAAKDCSYRYTYEEPPSPAGGGGGPASLVAAGII